MLTDRGLANASGGAWAERHGTPVVLGTALLVWGAALSAGSMLGIRPVRAVAIAVAITVGGVVDVVMNVAALASTPGRLVRFHAAFNAGAAVGAGLMGLALSTRLAWGWSWLVVGVLAAALGVVCLRTPLPGAGGGDPVRARQALGLLRRERLVVLAAAFAVAAMVEGGVELWGVLYVRTHLASGLLAGTSGAVGGYLVATAARVLVGPLVGRRWPRRGVAVGAALAAAGTVLIVSTRSAGPEVAGLVAAAGGISMCWPLLIAAAGGGRERPGAVVGAMSAVGYSGLVVGPALVGFVAGRAGIRVGLGLLAGAAVFVVSAVLVGPSPVGEGA